jgi:hypothetical protein
VILGTSKSAVCMWHGSVQLTGHGDSGAASSL